MSKGSIVERLCSDLDRKEPRYKCPTLLSETTLKARRIGAIFGRLSRRAGLSAIAGLSCLSSTVNSSKMVADTAKVTIND